MRICYISYVKYGGGAWVHTNQFIAALKAVHHDTVVYTPLAAKTRPGKIRPPKARPSKAGWMMSSTISGKSACSP